MSKAPFSDLPTPATSLLASVGGDLGEILSFIRSTALKGRIADEACTRFSSALEHSVRQMEGPYGYLQTAARNRHSSATSMKEVCDQAMTLLSLVFEAIADLDIPRDVVLARILEHAHKLKSFE